MSVGISLSMSSLKSFPNISDMQLNIVGLDVPLLFSPSFLREVEIVIDNNVNDNVQLTALFISRLLKGLQNLSNSDMEVLKSWDTFYFEIEEIGIVQVSPLFDSESNLRVYAIEAIQWVFAKGFFSKLLP